MHSQDVRVRELREDLARFHEVGIFTLSLIELPDDGSVDELQTCDRIMQGLGFDSLRGKWERYSVSEGAQIVAGVLARREVAFDEVDLDADAAAALAAQVQGLIEDVQSCFSNGRWLDAQGGFSYYVSHRRAAHSRAIASMRDLGVVFLGRTRALVFWYEE